MNYKKTQRSMDMVNGPLLKNIFIFSIPLMITNFLQMLFNTADTIVVGKFAGQEALAAVGATASIVFLLTSLFNGLSIGSNVVIAKLIGSQDEEGVSKAVHTSMCIAIIGGLLLIVIGFFCSKYFLSWMSTPSDIIDLSSLYMKIYFAGVLFLLVYNFGASVLRSKGDTQRPLYFLMISGVLNVALNLLFVIVFKWSVAGVALATVISEAVSAILVWMALVKESDATHLDAKKLKLDVAYAWDIMRVGIPAGIQGMVFSLSNVVIQSSINSFDSSVIVAGNSAAMNIEEFVYIGMMAFTQATITFTSQNIGAKRYDVIKKILWVTLILTVISSFLLGFLVWFFGVPFLSLYTNDAAVIEAGMVRLTYVALFLSLNGLLDAFVCSMRGMGYSSLPTVVMIIGICGVRLIWLWTVFPVVRTLKVIYLCFPISWTITSIIQAGLWYVLHQKLLKQNQFQQ